MKKRIVEIVSKFRARSKRTYILWQNDIRRRPILNFYLALGMFVLLIILSTLLRGSPKSTTTTTPEEKEVQIYTIGSVPRMTVQAQVEKSGIIKVMALSGGVVQKIHYHEGEAVYKGNTLISLSSNYQGGNTSSIQRELAANQYQSAVDTLDLQKNLIQQQRNVATTSGENADRLRDIAGQARDDTRNLISLNESMLSTVNISLTQLQNDPQADPAMIASLQGQKAQLLASLAQARTSLANADYQSASDKPPAELARLQKDITLKQLDLQEKMLNVNKEAARLQLALAQVAEAMMFPSSPVNGVVQRVFVKEGDIVSPGTQLAVVAQNTSADAITAIAYVPAEVATRVSKIDESVLRIGSTTYKEYPYFVSTEAVQGNSYAVYYVVPESFSSILVEKGYIDVEIPVGYADTSASAAFVPLDAVYQTNDNAYLFVINRNKAQSRQLKLGNVYGKYVEVKDGIVDGDRVIVSRNVIEGDKVIIK